MVFRIEIEKDLCISCGNCIDACDDIFEVGEDNYAQLVGGILDEDGFSFGEYPAISCAIEGAQSCPAGCILIFEDGNRIA
ncbi:MAG: ferredoxin [Methanobrevibacter sp.]|jgi:ferredoxin|nr:ferredoxin [Candidatus Methanoflexus mossambicus]